MDEYPDGWPQTAIQKIEELGETLECAYTLLAETIAEVLRCKEENDYLMATLEIQAVAIEVQKETITARDATIDKLEKALVPFSKLNIEDGNGGKVHIWHSDIRNARAALEPNRTEAEIGGKEEDD